jgi:hypothetical protein
MKKRRQHYVWRNYLRAWSSKERLFCLRNGEVFGSNLMGVGNQRDFYKLKELNEADVEFVIKFAIDQSPPSLRQVHFNTLEILTSVFKIKDELEKAGKNNPSVNQEIDELINNLEEDFHSSVEGNAVEYINSILSRDISFYKKK